MLTRALACRTSLQSIFFLNKCNPFWKIIWGFSTCGEALVQCLSSHNCKTWIWNYQWSNPWLGSRRGDMVRTLYDSNCQAGLSSAHLVRIGLSNLVHSSRLCTQSFSCCQHSLPPSRVQCSTILIRLLLWMIWPHHASFLLFNALTRFFCRPILSVVHCSANILVSHCGAVL